MYVYSYMKMIACKIWLGIYLSVLLCVSVRAATPDDAAEVFVNTDGTLNQFQLRLQDEAPDSEKPLKFDSAISRNNIPSIEITSQEGEEVFLESISPILLASGQHYALRTYLKFTDLVSAGKQRPDIGSEFIIYVHSSGEEYRVARIGASSETSDWIKVYLPFDPATEPHYEKVNIFFRIFALQGSIWICDPRIVKVPDNFPHDAFFELPSGEKVTGMLHYDQK